MSSIDLTTILANLSRSFLSVEHLAAELSRLLGVALIISGLIKLTKVNKYSNEGPAAPMACILGGIVLFYIPDSVGVLSNTLFGNSNILEYAQFQTFSIYDSIGVLVQTAGVIWFIRGCILLVHAAEPGKQEGIKGLLFVIAGVLALNFNFTVESLNTMFAYFMSLAGKAF